MSINKPTGKSTLQTSCCWTRWVRVWINFCYKLLIPTQKSFSWSNELIYILLIVNVFLPSLFVFLLFFFVVKPQQPANLTLTKNNNEFNLSWEMAYKDYENIDLFGYLMYRVRLRPKGIMDEVKKLHCIALHYTSQHYTSQSLWWSTSLSCYTINVMDDVTNK